MSTYTPASSSIHSYVYNNTTETSTTINNTDTTDGGNGLPGNLVLSSNYGGLGVFIGYLTINTNNPPVGGSEYGVYLNSSTTSDYTYTSITQITLYSSSYFPINILISTPGGSGGSSPNNTDTNNLNSYPGGGGAGGNLVQFTINKGIIPASESTPIIFMIYTQLSNDPNSLTSTLTIGTITLTDTTLTNINTFVIPAVSNGGSGTNSAFGIGSGSTSGLVFYPTAYPTYNVVYQILSTDVTTGGTNPTASTTTTTYAGSGTGGITISSLYLEPFCVCGGGCAGQLVTGGIGDQDQDIYGPTYNTIGGGGGNGGWQIDGIEQGSSYGLPATYFGGGGGGGATSAYTAYGALGGAGYASFVLINTAQP